MHPTTLKALSLKELNPHRHALLDATVFEFESIDGIAEAAALPKAMGPPGATLTGLGTQTLAYDRSREAVEISVNFTPREAKEYRSEFNFCVKHGKQFLLVLEGSGTFDENRRV